MKKISKKVISFILTISLLLTASVPALGVEFTKPSTDSVIIVDDGIYINNSFYTKDNFIQALNNTVKIGDQTQTKTYQFRSLSVLEDGTWNIPGVGIIIISAGVIMLGNKAIETGTWVYNAIVNWFTARAFNKSAETAVKGCDANKKDHILQTKHNWNKFNKEPNWNNVAPILVKVLKEGTEKWERSSIYLRTLVYKGETVVVRFVKDADGLVKYISTAWVE